MLESVRRKVPRKKPQNRSLRWNVNTNYGIIPIIFYRKDSFEDLALIGISAGEPVLAPRTEIQFSTFKLTARPRLRSE